MKIERESAGYQVRFLGELKGGKGEPASIPYEIEGPPGLISVEFHFSKKGEADAGEFVHAFSAPIQRPGMLYSFPSRKTTGGRPLLRGKVDLPPHFREGGSFELDVEVRVKSLHAETS